MNVLIIRSTPAGRKAFAIAPETVKAMVAEGRAYRDKNGMYFECKPEKQIVAELPESYQTKTVEAPKRKRGRPRKQVDDA